MADEKIVEAMAEAAHEAWLNACAEQGIISRQAAWGEEFIVPWADLSERGREFDRVIMRGILKAFDTNGYDVRQRAESNPQVKYIGIREFCDEGFLQEVNRQFLHPMGLALEVTEQDNGECYISGVWDDRGDSIGMAFGDGVLSEEKFHSAMAEYDRHVDARRQKFGTTIQPLLPREG